MYPPKVSVITVTYNAAEALRVTLDNLSRVDYTALEVVVIDGASTDHTAAVVESYADRVNYYTSEPDRGIYDAMNKGLRAATGDYVWFINAGDRIHRPESIGRIFVTAAADTDIFYGETLIREPNGTILGLRKKKLPRNLTWVDFFRGMVVCHQSIVVRREIAPEYDLKYRIAADVDWVLQCLRNAETIVNTGRILSEFETGGASSRRRRQAWKERYKIMWKYFGHVPTAAAHLLFVFDSFKSDYRKYDPGQFGK